MKKSYSSMAGIICQFAVLFFPMNAASLWGQTTIAGKTTIETQQASFDCDGLILEAAIDIAKGQTNDLVKRVIILVPGSGAHSMDVDLSTVTKGKAQNFVFKTIGGALAETGFAVIRYNKRNFQIRKLLKAAPEAEETKTHVKSIKANPLKHFVDDVLSIVDIAQKRFPNAEVYLLGHSEGTYVSLQAANQNDDIAGVALIGFAEYSTNTLAYAQTVYRPLHNFAELDKNVDGQLDNQELNADTQLAKSLKLALKLLDNNKDGSLSRAEYQAANFANLLVQDTFGPFRKQEAEYPRVAEILKSTDKKIAFFQGMLDNQTPAFHTMAFELLLTQMGKTKQMQFNYFPGLGHALDSRENYQDAIFSPIDHAALMKLTNSLDQFFKKD